MKETLAVVLAMTTLTTLGETIWIDGVQWTYIVKDEGVQIGTGELFDTAIPRDTLGSISVPAEINGLPVVEIASHAFFSLKYVYKIDIPTSVSTIGYRVFAECRDLETVLLPDGVSIGGNAFSFSDKIKYPVFSKTGKSLYAFSSDQTTSPATSYIVPNGVEFIGNNAFASAGKMTSISWPDSLKCIGEYAFRDCPFENVEIPSSVTNIGEGAFSGCRNLCSIALPDTLESINGSTFWRCCSLTNIVIPNSVKTIGPGAFSNCSALESISIPAAVTNIGGAAFSDCPLLEFVEIDPANETYKSQGLVLFSKDGSELNAFLELQVQTYDIPNSVRSIADYAFDGCSNLVELVIPNSVTNIGRGAFHLCSGLTSITIPDSVTNIGAYAFEGCSGMTNLCLPRSFRGKTANMGIPCNVVFSGPCSFRVLSEHGSPWPESGMHDVSDGEIIECSVSGIDDAGHTEGIRYVCTGWRGTGSVPENGEGTNVTFTITEDSTLAWTWATNVWIAVAATGPVEADFVQGWIDQGSNVVVSWTPMVPYFTIALTGDTNGAVLDEDGQTLAIPADRPRFVTLVAKESGGVFDGDYAADVNGTVWHYSVSNGVATITGLETERTIVSIPAAIGSVPVAAIGDWCFCESFTGLDGAADIETLVLPASVESVGHAAFATMENLREFSVAEENASFTAIDGVLFDATCEALVAYPAARTGSSFVIPSGVRRIGSFAFESSRLERIVVPDGVENIGSDAFSFCENLIEIRLPETPVDLGLWVFEGCSSLSQIHFPAALGFEWDENNQGAFDLGTAVDQFYGCTNLVSIEVDEGNPLMKSVDGALYDKAGRSLLVVPPGRVGTFAVPPGVETLGPVSFMSCQKLTSILFPDGLVSIGSPFFHAILPSSLVVPDGVTNAWFDTWTDENTLKKLVVPDALADAFEALGGSEWNRPVPEGCSVIRRSELAGRKTASNVPLEWFYNYGTLLDRTDDDCEAAAVAIAANSENEVWECYVAGLDPTSAAARFEARIGFDTDGKPVVTWTPDLNEGGTKHERAYRILGAKSLGDAEPWDDVTGLADPDAAGYRFFKAKVTLPE